MITDVRIRTTELRCRNENFGNLLLRCLPDSESRRIRRYLEPVELKSRRVLHYPRMPFDHVYFLERGLVSVFANTGHGKSVETWLIGNEGLVGIPVILGQTVSTHRRVVQVGGRAFRIDAGALCQILDESPAIRRVMLSYVHTVLVQASQLGACNAHHSVQERLARWMLMAQDRCDSDILPLTHDMLSRMLGVRRATVSECIALLESRGIVARSRCAVTIADRAKLKEAACVCYGIIRHTDKEFARFCEPHMADGDRQPAARLPSHRVSLGL